MLYEVAIIRKSSEEDKQKNLSDELIAGILPIIAKDADHAKNTVLIRFAEKLSKIPTDLIEVLVRPFVK